MNINFHYYTIKTIARRAGLNEATAQMLATYSQLVDDFDIYASIQLEYVPEYAQHLATKNSFRSGWTFYPVTTGFNSLIDMGRLFTETNQKYITVPFHFVPTKPLENPDPNKRLYPTEKRELLRTRPARLDNPSLMRTLLFLARDRFYKNQSDQNKMFIGMLLHIFADTYAHQQFSGFQGWENHCKITQAVDTMNGEDLTSKYNKAGLLPAIGHTEAYHAPDDSYLEFDMRLRLNEKDNYTFYYNRSNTREFLLAAKEIYDYIVECFLLDPMSSDEWETFKRHLVHGLWFTQTDIPTLNWLWHGEFPEYEYNYVNPTKSSFILADSSANRTNLSETELIQKILYHTDPEVNDLLLKVKNDNFFCYNVLAKEIRDTVNGITTSVNAIAEANSPSPC